MTAREADVELIGARCRPDALTLTWKNSSYSVYSALWLRDNDPARRDDRTGQRLGSVSDLPLEPALRAVEQVPAGHLTLRWEDGHSSVFSLAWLKAYDLSLRIGIHPTRQPWMGQPAENFAWCDYAEWVARPAAREEWLYYAARDGVAFLRNGPLEQDMVLRVAESIGYVRETSHGRIFDVPGVAQPGHTSAPYRDPAPGFQLHHCLSVAADGGESIFVDGMAVSERLRARDAEAFSTLCQIPVIFRFQDATVDIAAERTMLNMDPRGQFCAIYYDDRSIAPLPLKGPQLKKYYVAYRQLANLVREAAREVVYRWQPGDLVLFDNSRILQGRTASSADHLQGCYVDADGLYSTLAVHARQTSAQHDH